MMKKAGLHTSDMMTASRFVTRTNPSDGRHLCPPEGCKHIRKVAPVRASARGARTQSSLLDLGYPVQGCDPVQGCWVEDFGVGAVLAFRHGRVCRWPHCCEPHGKKSFASFGKPHQGQPHSGLRRENVVTLMRLSDRIAIRAALRPYR